ncbi:MAG: glycine cleavage system protein GcvH [Nitrososphaerota archaeon]
MIEIEGYKIIENLLYSKDHVWIKIENNKAKIGITDYIQKNLHDIVYIELPEINSNIHQGKKLALIESIKTISEIHSPLTGKILKTNEELKSKPGLINESPYENGWIAIIKPINFEKEKSNLLNFEEYLEYIRKIIEKEKA